MINMQAIIYKTEAVAIEKRKKVISQNIQKMYSVYNAPNIHITHDVEVVYTMSNIEFFTG